jgi:hypothetical protein
MSPEEEQWLQEQLDLQLVEAAMEDLPGTVAADHYPGHDKAELTADELREFDAFVERQSQRQLAEARRADAAANDSHSL